MLSKIVDGKCILTAFAGCIYKKMHDPLIGEDYIST